jgi:hypothetical protein
MASGRDKYVEDVRLLREELSANREEFHRKLNASVEWFEANVKELQANFRVKELEQEKKQEDLKARVEWLEAIVETLQQDPPMEP